MKQAIVYWKTLKVGILLTESNEGYSFAYNKDYLTMPEAQGISQTIPLREEPFQSNTLHPFFDGLIPEGWLKLPMEDMCQLSDHLTEYKYKGSDEQIVKLIIKHSSVSKLDLVKFW